MRVAERFSQHLGADLAFVHKRRPRGTHNQVEALDVVGEVEGRHCVLIDDMIDTAGTICAAAELLAERGAADISAMATHPVLSDPATTRLEKSPLSRVVVTDTLPISREAHREAGRPLGGQAHRRRHRRRVRGHLGVGDLRGRQPDLTCGGGLPSPAPGLLCWVARSSHPGGSSPMAESHPGGRGRPSVGLQLGAPVRHDGRIPAVVYGPGVDPIPVSVAARDLRAALSTDAGLDAVLSLQVEGKKFLTMARELQRHPVRGSVTHVDFQVVDPNREVTAEVTITLTGEALELHRADGVLEQQMFSLTIKSRPADIPAHLEVDISDLVIGSAVRVSDIALPANVMTEVDPESIVAAGQAPRVQAVEGEGVEGEGVEGEAAEGESRCDSRRASADAGGESGGES